MTQFEALDQVIAHAHPGTRRDPHHLPFHDGGFSPLLSGTPDDVDGSSWESEWIDLGGEG